MSAYSGKSSIEAYRSVSAHGNVAVADPHRLILLLMDGALERIAAARGAIEHDAKEATGKLLHRAVSIIDELRASLNLASGGEIAANLADLYEYAGRQLMRANLENKVELLDEVSGLLREIRSAWIQIPSQPV